jgi:molybdopterin molybdotransferase
MITVEEALEKILSTVHVLDDETKPILSCLGQVLDEDVTAGFDIPPHDNSAMDGYAVIAADTAGASQTNPSFLKVTGEVAAGQVSKLTVNKGTAIRIMTGAYVPQGADAVVRFEETDETTKKGGDHKTDKIGIFTPAEAGQNIRLRGEDVTAAQVVMRKGTLLRPAEIGLLASVGHAKATVIRRPVVAVLPTGDELCDVNKRLAPGKIYDSNSYTIAANVMNAGGIPKILRIALDTKEALNARIDEAMEADMLITSGGVSMGDYDVVKDILAQRGQINFWTVRMKPGKPLAFGVIDKGPSGRNRKIPHLGLPGNPVSSMITFELYGRPAIRKMLGRKSTGRPTVTARLDQEIINTDGRRIFARVHVEKDARGWQAYLTGPQGSGILSSMSAANGLAIVPEDWPAAKAGSIVKVMLLENVEGPC